MIGGFVGSSVAVGLNDGGVGFGDGGVGFGDGGVVAAGVVWRGDGDFASKEASATMAIIMATITKASKSRAAL